MGKVHRDCEGHDFGLKPTRAILLWPWERNFRNFPCLAVLASSSKFHSYLHKTKNSNKKFQPNSKQQYHGITGSKSG